MKQVALGPRAAEILHSIVQSYIETGDPVASRTISRRRRDGLSAASIRNVMADLCEMGYLAQPHTSAGRVPTETAFRSYVQSLAAKRLLAAEVDRVRSQFNEAGSMESRVELSSQILTEMTNNVGIAAAIPTTTQILDSIELIGIPDRRVLMIVVTRDRMVRNQVVMLEELVTQDDLNSIRNYVNQNFAGWALTDVRRELISRFEEESAAYDTILRRLTVLFEKGLLDLGLAPEVHMDGVSNLIGLDLHLTRERLRELFRALEEKKRLLMLLDQFLESRSGEIAVRVGLGDAHPSMRELSLIGLTVVLPGGIFAKVAVLGHMRMDYQKVISAVQHVGEAIQRPPV
ncbi:MAG: heat-inducible transcriptional repressor HrcA [Bryobacteraceae bacterium]